MGINVLPSEAAAVVATIDPDVYVASTELSDAVDMSKFESIQAIVMAGTLGASATLDGKLVQATTAGGTYKDITGKAITQLVKATDDDKQAVINCRAEELDLANNYRWVKLSMTVGTATSDAGAIIMGHNPHYGPASDSDLASVAEIIS